MNIYTTRIIDAAHILLSGEAGQLTEKQMNYTRSILASAEKFIHLYVEFQAASIEHISSKMRHDLGNPLTPIQGYSELLMLGLIGTLTKHQQEQVEIIADSTTALHKMVDQMVEDARSRVTLATVS